MLVSSPKDSVMCLCLPDIYTTDAQGSPRPTGRSWSWLVERQLGGMQPSPFPLFFRYLVGWATPVVIDYQTGAQQVKVGQLSKRRCFFKSSARILSIPKGMLSKPLGETRRLNGGKAHLFGETGQQEGAHEIKKEKGDEETRDDVGGEMRAHDNPGQSRQPKCKKRDGGSAKPFR